MAKISKLDTVDAMLSKIDDPAGQGALVFTQVFHQQARACATSADTLNAAGVEQHPLAGLAISVKDLFDVQGQSTLAGSRVLSSAAPAARDAVPVARLRACGAAIIGKTNMTEFAFSGLGINPHYGTPLGAWERDARRIPGGSSSGAAVSITDGMAWAAIGTDTGGSCRIPAALNGIVGMKPTASAVPREGTLPLSFSYDSVGPLAANVTDCAQVYAALSGSAMALGERSLSTLRLGVLQNYVLDGMDDTVGQAYEAALAKLAAAGVQLVPIRLDVLDDMPTVLHGGGLVAAEAFQWHRELLSSRKNEYDPRVSLRIQRGEGISAADYIGLQQLRARMVRRWSAQIAAFDALLMPTVPTVAPRLDELADEGEYGRVNLLMLRNPTIVNVLDGCAVSLPCHAAGTAPVGLSVVGAHGRDWDILGFSRAIERLFQHASADATRAGP